MDEERREEVEEELRLAWENWHSYKDNRQGRRFRKATSDLYFFSEHAAKALLLTVGIDPQTHEGIRRMISLHFIKPGVIPVQVARYMGNLYDRRKTAEYSRLAGWEFTEDEIRTYTLWAGESAGAFLRNLAAQMPELRPQADELIHSIDDTLEGLLSGYQSS